MKSARLLCTGSGRVDLPEPNACDNGAFANGQESGNVRQIDIFVRCFDSSDVDFNSAALEADRRTIFVEVAGKCVGYMLIQS